MTADGAIPRNVIAAQGRMFSLAEARHGLTRKVLVLETGIPASTLKSWANDTAMPVYGLVLLSKVIPDYLTSLLLEPGGKAVTTSQDDDGDLDALAIEASGYVCDYVAAKADGKVTHIERAKLGERKRRLRAVAA